MSIKAFHIVFIVIASLFLVGFGLWNILVYRQIDIPGSTVLALVAFGSLAAVAIAEWRILGGLRSAEV